MHAVFWAVGDDIGPHYQLSGPQLFPENRERIARVHRALADEESRQQFLGHLKWRVALEPESMPLGDRRRMYFDPALFDLGHDAVIADCGAFDGDSLRVLLFWYGRKFKAFHAFEPDPVTFARLEDFIRALPMDIAAKVHPVQMALGKESGFIRSAGTGLPGSKREDGNRRSRTSGSVG